MAKRRLRETDAVRRREKPVLAEQAAPPPPVSELPELLDPASDEFAYRVAAHAWVDGLTANAIVRKLGYKAEPVYLMQVKRALRRAQDRFLKLVPLLHDQLRGQLVDRVKKNNPQRDTRFYVVDDTRGPTGGPVYVKAAELVSEIIIESVRRKLDTPSAQPQPDGPAKPDVVICNAGGQTVSEMVKVLQRTPPVPDESNDREEQLRQRLLFVAANDAYDPRQFQLSANFLSVTMAELFGAKHRVYPTVEVVESQRDYEKLVENAALFICGAGTRENGLMAQLFRNAGLKLPDQAVGDLAFNFLDRNGVSVDPPSEQARQFMKKLNPTLDLARLLNIAKRNRVVLVLDAPQPEQKKELAIAALRREYATDVVLGARLARAILQDF